MVVRGMLDSLSILVGPAVAGLLLAVSGPAAAFGVIAGASLLSAVLMFGLHYEVAVNLHTLGDILVHLEDYARAYGAIKQSLALCDELDHDRLAI